MNKLSTSLIELPPPQQAIRDRCFHPSGVFEEFKKEEIEQSIPDRFEKIAVKYPDRIAVKTRNCLLSYRELNEAANRIARAILERCGAAEEPIAVLIEDSPPTIAAILGILKAGKLYVPLDLSHPQSRIQAVVKSSRASLIVTNNLNFPLAEKLADASLRLINIDNLDVGLSHKNLGLSISPDAPAAILYTSGSTGEPKGAVHSNRNLLHDARNYTNSLHICAEDRLLILSGYRIWDIFRVLLNGAALVPFHFKEEGLGRLASWLVDEEITIYHSASSAFRYFVDTLTGKEEFPSLRLIHLGGEPVSKREVELFKKHFSSSCILLNNLGSTETSIFRQYLIDKGTHIAGNVVPVGYALEDKEVLLLDDRGGQVGSNGVGEIAVRSRYLSLGYWQRPDLTQAAFLPDPEGGEKRIYRTGDLGCMREDGRLEHLGRKDFRVKIRGYRVEVGEVEMALQAHPAVKDAVVTAQEYGEGEQRLIAYLVCKAEEKPTAHELREFLTRTFPEHMIPAAFVALDAFPLTSGKVDRRALPAPDLTRPELTTPFVSPRTPVEEDLARIWAEVLDLDSIGVHDNFLDLGGHSLMATRIISRAIEKFGAELSMKSLLEAPTVAEMAAVVTENQAKTSSREDLGNILAELETLSDDEAQRLLSDKDKEVTRR